MRSLSCFVLALVAFASLAACGSDGSGSGSGGTGGAVGAGGGAGTAGATTGAGGASAGSLCQRGCVATLAAACSNGPTSQSDCETTCQGLETGTCGSAYQALQSCADGQAITCNAMGMPIIAACSTQQSAFVACLN